MLNWQHDCIDAWLFCCVLSQRVTWERSVTIKAILVKRFDLLTHSLKAPGLNSLTDWVFLCGVCMIFWILPFFLWHLDTKDTFKFKISSFTLKDWWRMQHVELYFAFRSSGCWWPTDDCFLLKQDEIEQANRSSHFMDAFRLPYSKDVFFLSSLFSLRIFLNVSNEVWFLTNATWEVLWWVSIAWEFGIMLCF